ncbi:MAG: hypothetical protein CM1200mP30_31740 [Pseudomonadota bacterium]|nr:MAG: hypothetical protein CM1200mP30_31740 [Pseudomonadota bacterium]
MDRLPSMVKSVATWENKLGDVPFSGFAEMLGGYGAEIREPQEIQPALKNLPVNQLN